MSIVRLLLSLSFVCLFLIDATAKNTSTTTYSYFKVFGQSAPQIYASLLVHAKAPDGHDAYATTTTRIFQKAKFSVGASCSVKNYDTKATFNIALPHLASPEGSPVVGAKWQSFAAMLRRHEEHHRSLWLACVENFNNRAESLSANSCDALGKKFAALWKSTEAACRRENDAFDRLEQRHFLKQSFIQLVVQQ